MKQFQPIMINLSYIINVPGSGGGSIRQVEAEGGIYHATNTVDPNVYFLYDPFMDVFYWYDYFTQIPGEPVSQEELNNYVLEEVDPENIDI